MDVKHTPGPWGWDSRNGRYYLLTFHPNPTHHIVLGRMSGIDPADLIPDDEMGRADLDLIAAAPELLEALKNVMALHCPHPRAGEPWVDTAARAAIAKAEGGRS